MNRFKGLLSAYLKYYAVNMVKSTGVFRPVNFFVFRIDIFREKEYNLTMCPKVIKGERK